LDEQDFVYSDDYSAQHIANLRKVIDRQFYSPRHVAGVVLKLLRIVHWRVLARGALTIPAFLTLLVAKQAANKVRKWMGARRPAEPSAVITTAAEVQARAGLRTLAEGSGTRPFGDKSEAA
jgi:hypothetical protein